MNVSGLFGRTFRHPVCSRVLKPDHLKVIPQRKRLFTYSEVITNTKNKGSEQNTSVVVEIAADPQNPKVSEYKFSDISASYINTPELICIT